MDRLERQTMLMKVEKKTKQTRQTDKETGRQKTDILDRQTDWIDRQTDRNTARKTER